MLNSGSDEQQPVPGGANYERRKYEERNRCETAKEQTHRVERDLPLVMQKYRYTRQYLPNTTSSTIRTWTTNKNDEK